MNKDAGRKWPIIIGLSIVGVIALSVATVKIAMNNPVELSDYGMQNYHLYDANANDIIQSKIAFDRRYDVAFATPQIREQGTVLIYKVTDKNGTAVDNATFEVIMTRPDTCKSDVNATVASVQDGIYTFKSIDLPKPGRWDILAKVTVGSDQRFFNIKADTRTPKTSEF